MDNVVLSICIPTYNRRDAVYDCVIKILNNYESDDIEVIVSDNCSTDGTEEKLRTIHDKRLKYYKNAENTKYLNFLIAMSHATGKFSLLISDEDDIKTELLPGLLKYLTLRPEYALIKSDVFMIDTHKVRHYKCDVSSYYNKIKAIVCWACVSGVIYNNRFILPILRKMNFNDWKRYQKNIGEFPHIWLALMICHKGGISFYPEVLVVQARIAPSDYLASKTKEEYTWSIDRVLDTNSVMYKSFKRLKLSKLSSKEKVALYCNRTWLLTVQVGSDYLQLMYGGGYESFLREYYPWDIEAFYKCKKQHYHHMKNTYLAYKTTNRFLVTSLWNSKRDFIKDCMKNCSLILGLYYDTLKEYQKSEKYLKTIKSNM